MVFLWLLPLLVFVYWYQTYQQPNAKLPAFQDELRDLQWGQLNFLHTTDTHSWYLGHTNQKQYSADWGDYISFVTHMSHSAAEKGTDLIVVDTGDKHDGNGLGDVTEVNGLYSDEIFIKQDFDMVTIGNHELYVEEITEREFTEIVPLLKDLYVCTNVEYIEQDGTIVPFGKRYKIFNTPEQGLKIMGLGILFDFQRQNNRAKVTPVLELIELDWFKELLKSSQIENLDMILVIGHIPVSHEWLAFQVLHDFIRSYHPNLPIQYFGGHSHIRDFVKLDATSHGLQSGRYCETIGWLSIKDLQEENLTVDRKYIDFNLHSLMHHSNQSSDDFNTLEGSQITMELSKISTKLNLNHIYGQVPQNYLLNSSPINSENNLLNFLSTKILTRLKPNVLNPHSLSDSRIIIINTGSIRYDLYKGPFTTNSKYIVSPFKNKWRFISRVPKHIALRVIDILNDSDYLLKELRLIKSGDLEPFMTRLVKSETLHSLEQTEFTNNDDNYFQFRQRSYGYVTRDDFGTDGDDTIHKAFKYYREPNALQSYEGDGEYIDVIYYDFIEQQVIFALKQLSFEVDSTQVYNDLKDEFNVGQLLQDYIHEFWN